MGRQDWRCIVSASIFEKTAKRAVRASKRDGRLRFILAGGHGFLISMRRPFQDCYCTNGDEFYFWEQSSNAGAHRPSMTAAFCDKEGAS